MYFCHSWFFFGFVSGVTGAIGLLFKRLYLRYSLTKEEIVSTQTASEIFLHLTTLTSYLFLGFYLKSAF